MAEGDLDLREIAIGIHHLHGNGDDLEALALRQSQRHHNQIAQRRDGRSSQDSEFHEQANLDRVRMYRNRTETAHVGIGPALCDNSLVLHSPHTTSHAANIMAKLLFTTALLIASTLSGPSLAQIPTSIAPDGTLGSNVTRTGPTFNIDGGTIKGANQFHSFDRFTVGTGDTARFNGPQSVTNILSRVTGLQSGLTQSVIDGTLQSTIPGANLFLLNPAGVLFGPNASLDVSGSFHVSTADVLRFDDGSEFHTDLAATSTLTIATPEAFGFLNENPSGVAIDRSSLVVPVGETLSLVGGDVTITGAMSGETTSLKAPEGRIQIASIAAAGEVIPINLVQDSSVTADTADRFGKLSLTQGAFIDVSGDSGGIVVIRGGEFVVENSRVFADTLADGQPGAVMVNVGTLTLTDGGRITSDSVGPGKGGLVSITATGTVTLTGTTPDGTIPSGLFANALVESEQAGDAGNVIVVAEHVIVTNLAAISSSTFGPGQGGTVTVTASDSVSLSEGLTTIERSGIFAATLAAGDNAGNAGNVIVEAKNIAVSEGATIATATLGPGQGGDMTVTASDSITLAGTSSDGNNASTIAASAFGESTLAGDAGNVIVEANIMTVTDGATIESTTLGPGHGGSVLVTVRDTLTLVGTRPDGTFESGVFAEARGQGTEAGNAGDIVVEAKNIAIEEGATISSTTFGPGQGGGVSVSVLDTLTLSGTSRDGTIQSGLFANAQGRDVHAGSAGDVTVEATNVIGTDLAAISSSTFGPGQGGTVTVTASDSVTLSGSLTTTKRSGIFAATLAASDHAGNAGNVIVKAKNVVVTEGAAIATATFGPGQGGAVTVTTSDSTILSGTTADGDVP